eukprot:Blabericola_migrator_1__903@NODE_1222_length_5065_cov_188_919768_g829_i0_p1_GENE_NODE_1222_length_5065_cov_188_919768_g829_i0NODE_1222_length_5065_cov_188_919768_g829_i0_p1_ORF_typecomplete_len615_score78_44Aa_trans/PF01490_18/5_3e54Aa_trans/PF01490_18/1_5e03Trp_Tyr_perm/PF03222_13/0_0056Trp_Tyr_perm/PF03222_13/67Trp_Tyr_perm/PF03222_13/3_8e03_NODE_1222_length_5065_cov_188_919768_g829_i013013145
MNANNRRIEPAPRRASLPVPDLYGCDSTYEDSDNEEDYVSAVTGSHAIDRISQLLKSADHVLEKAPPLHHDFDKEEGLLITEENRAGKSLPIILALCKGFIGSGILLTPYAVYKGGFLFSIGSLFFLWGFNQFGIMSLLSLADHTHLTTYGALGQRCLGPMGRVAVNCSIVASQLGFCIVIMCFAGNAIRDVIFKWVGGCVDETWRLSLTSTIIPQVFVILPVTLGVRKVKHLGPLILIANTLIVIVLTAVFTRNIWVITHKDILPAFKGDSPNEPLQERNMVVRIVIGLVNMPGLVYHHLKTDFKFWVFNADGALISLGICAYIFEGISLVLPVRESHKHPKYAELCKKTICGVAICIILFASSGILAYGPEVNKIVLLNLPRIWWGYALQIMYCCAVIISFPLQLMPVVKITEHFIFHRRDEFYPPGVRKRDSVIRKTNYKRTTSNSSETSLLKDQEWIAPIYLRRRVRQLVQLTLIFGSLSVALFCAGRLDNLVAIIGAFCCTPLAFLYPSLFTLAYKEERSPPFTRVSHFNGPPSTVLEGSDENSSYPDLIQRQAWFKDLDDRSHDRLSHSQVSVHVTVIIFTLTIMALCSTSAIQHWTDAQPSTVTCDT